MTATTTVSVELEPGNGGLQRLAVPDDQPPVHSTGGEARGTPTGHRVDGDLGDGVLVGGLQRGVLGSGRSSLVQTLELLHGTEGRRVASLTAQGTSK